MEDKNKTLDVKKARKENDDSKKEPVSIVPQNAAKTAMMSIFKTAVGPSAPRLVVKRDGGGSDRGTVNCKFIGIVTSVRDEKVTGRSGQTIPKTRLNISGIVPIGNNAQDIIDCGIPGETVLFPSTQIDDPSAAEEDKGFKVKKRALQVSAMQSVAKLNDVSISIYNEGKDGPSAASTAKVGMEMEVSGVCANPVDSSIFINASKVTQVASAPAAHNTAKFVMEYCMRPEQQKQAVFNCSRTADGWFDTVGLNAAQEHQARVCQAMWRMVLQGTADRLGVMAQGKPEAMAAELNAHEHRIRALSAESLAKGELPPVWIESSKHDANIAPIVCKGILPWNDVNPLAMTLMDGGASAEALPGTLAIPVVSKVDTTLTTIVSVEITMFSVFDKEGALQALREGKDSPLLMSHGPAACFTLSLRTLAPEFGTWKKNRVMMAAKELLRYADFAAFVKVSNLEKGAVNAIKTDFCSGFFLDMKSTLKKSSIKVSEDFIKREMCFGNTQYVAKKDKDEKLDPMPNTSMELPTLLENHYQELSTDSFVLDDLQKDADKLGKKIEFRVVYPDVIENLKETGPGETEDATKGDAHMVEICKDVMEVREMITNHALVYAMLV